MLRPSFSIWTTLLLLSGACGGAADAPLPGRGGAEPCSVNGDCRNGSTCDLAAGLCREMQPGECRNDDPTLCVCELNSHCPADFVCGGDGLCIPGNNPAPGRDAGPIAGSDAGPVTERCDATADCPIDQFCNPGSRSCEALRPPSCRADSQCTSGSCEIQAGRELGRCAGGLGECTDNSDCAAGETCEEGSCVGGGTGCQTNLDCGFREVCEEGSCVPNTSCQFDFQCPGDQICRNQECVIPECSEDADCGAGRICDERACVAGEREDDHGNTFASATEVGDNSQTPGVLNYGGDIDVFRFRTTVDGDYTVGTIGNTDTRCALITADDNELGNDDDGGEGSNCEVTHTLIAGAIFQVQVRGFSERTTGAYAIVIRKPQGGNNGGGNNGNDDHGNDAQSATEVLEGVETPGAIDGRGDHDFFRFVASETGPYRIYTSGTTDTYCYLHDNGGQTLARNDDAGEALNCLITSQLIQGTTYFVEVQRYMDRGVGSYSLHIGPDMSNRLSEALRNNATATAIPAEVAAQLIAGTSITYRFTTGAAGNHRLETTGTTDTFCGLFDAGGRPVGAANDDGGAGTNCRIDADLAAATTYYFAVRGFSEWTSGAYTLVITAR